MTINEKQDEIIEEFDLFDDQLDKTQYIIDLGKKLPPMPEAQKTDENRIMGCQSKVWVDAELKDDNRTGARPGEARPGEARPGEARPGEARPGEARPGEARPGEARPGEARPGEARPGEARPGEARLYFYGDSEPTAQISKGLVSLLIRVLSGEKPEDIANADLYFIPRVGMGNLITSLRAGGLASMIERMKAYGRAYTEESYS